MKGEGKYLHLWLKYADVIHVLLKKTDVENQKLQLYKHEFGPAGQKQIPNVAFSLDLINGRAQKITNTPPLARDLWQVLDNKAATRSWLKERKVRISIDKSFELQLEKITEPV